MANILNGLSSVSFVVIPVTTIVLVPAACVSMVKVVLNTPLVSTVPITLVADTPKSTLTSSPAP